MKTLRFYVVLCVAFCSCLHQKYLAKNQVVFKAESLSTTKSQLKAYKSGNKSIKVIIKDTAGVLLIHKKDSTGRRFILPTIVQASFSTTPKYATLAATGKYYFPETFFPRDGDSNSNHLFVTPQWLKYHQNSFVLQAVTTPLKIRPAFTKARLKDSLKVQSLAELNIGLAIGLKRLWCRYKAQPYDNGQKASSFSLSGSFFTSIGRTNVKPITTRYLYPYGKTEPCISYGGIFFIGFNSVNIGFSVGTDHLFNSTIAKRWIYDGSLWYGITVGYDLIK